MKKIIALLVLVMLLAGCSDAKDTVETQTANDASSTDSLDDTFYRIVKFDINENRSSYYRSFNTVDFQTIGRELEVLSTDEFSTSDYYMAEGQILKYDNMEQLTKRNNDNNDYEYSLQPDYGRVISNVTAPTMVSTVYELDFYSRSGDDYQLAGASFAIVLDPRETNNTQLSTYMDESEVIAYGREVIPKLYDYLKTLDEIKSLPVNICVYYATNTNESEIDGRYILKSYCNGDVGEIETLDYDMLMFSSSEAATSDEETSSQFEIFKSNIKNVAVEAVGVIGYGRYRDGQLQSLRININANVKTYTELLHLIETAADELNAQFGNEYDITVLVYSQDQLENIIIKERGESAKSILLY
ncbi:CamS family sex pheromone protein [uncultured Thomasclavelia sp.]|uniref:CamS family sex pheromone protein n=1 Tax=uncultured Thomasclavelia sp. TaxID=3025759 RepID=UPI0025F13E7D|nr:CamS family sex pheromone protein [uncultured Thomasclavelia sp.]